MLRRRSAGRRKQPDGLVADKPLADTPDFNAIDVPALSQPWFRVRCHLGFALHQHAASRTLLRPVRVALLDVVLKLSRAPVRRDLILSVSYYALSTPQVRKAAVRKTLLLALGVDWRREADLARDPTSVQHDALDYGSGRQTLAAPIAAFFLPASRVVLKRRRWRKATDELSDRRANLGGKPVYNLDRTAEYLGKDWMSSGRLDVDRRAQSGDAAPPLIQTSGGW